MKQDSESSQKHLYVQLGKLIKNARERKGFTQASLAEISLLSRTSITNIEKGRQHLPLHTLYIIAQALGTKVADLLPEIKSATETIYSKRIPKDLDNEEREWIQHAVSDTAKRSER